MKNQLLLVVKKIKLLMELLTGSTKKNLVFTKVFFGRQMGVKFHIISLMRKM